MSLERLNVMEIMPDENYCLFGAEVLLKRLNALEQEIEGVFRAEDIECIHRMRVASRRLRSAFALFEECFPEKNVKKWKKQIRSVTRTLGLARDIDVQIDFLQEFLNSLTTTRHVSGIKRLRLRLKQRREKIQPKVISAMENIKNNGVLNEIAESALIIRNVAQMHNKDDHSPQVYERAYVAISFQLEDFLTYERYVYQPDKINELHAMRISSKRLRYTMEIFSSLYDDELEQPIKVAREFQTILGDIHDCVVWIEFLPLFFEQEKACTLEYFGNTRSFSRLKTGILYLQEERKKQQAGRYKEFVNYWKQTQDQDVWGILLKHILHHISKKE
jgi:CHAD domain-containing protein